MICRTIIPEYQRVILPMMTVLIFRHLGEIKQLRQQSCALNFVHALDVRRELSVDEDGLLLRHGMLGDNRMQRWRIVEFELFQLLAFFAGVTKILLERQEVVKGFKA